MSYLVLARKWRPQTFDQIVGQPHVTKTLQNAILAGRVAHAYLFAGARGVGKTSVARILAKALNCERGISPVPCNACSNCREITQGNAVDVLEIDGASNRGIDSIRELRETIRFRPAKSPYKVYIIDEVHMLTTEAFNALLKTLEEPPAHIVFVFATTEPHKIPATILSRCQRFDFRRISTGQVLRQLETIAAREGLTLPEGLLYAVAREAEGSMRDAQSLLEQVLAFSSDGGVEAEILDLLGVIDRQSILQAGRAVLTGDAVACLRLVDDLYQRGLDIKRFSRRLCEHFRNLLVFALGGDGAAGMLDLPADDVAALAADVRDVTAESLQIYFQVLLKGEEEIRRSDLPRVALEMLLLRLAQLPRLESLEAVLTRLEDLEQAFAGGPAADLSAGASAVGGVSRRAPGESTGPAAKSSPLPAEEPPGWVTAPIKGPFEAPAGADIPAGPGPLPSRDPLRDWPEFLQWLRKAEPFLEAKLAQSRVAAAEGGGSSLELTVPGIFEEAVSEPRTLEKLTAAASRFFSRDVHWVVRTAKPGEANGQAHGAHRATKPGRQRKVIEHPLVQQALEILGGELVDIRRVPPAAPAPGGAAASRRGRRVAEKAKDARPPATR